MTFFKPRPDTPADAAKEPASARGWLLAFALLSLYLAGTLLAALCVAWGPKGEGGFSCDDPGIYLSCEYVAQDDLVIEFAEFSYDREGEGCILRSQVLTDTTITGITLRVEEDGLTMAGDPLSTSEPLSGRTTLFPFSPWLLHRRQFTAQLAESYDCRADNGDFVPQPVGAYVYGEVHASIGPNPLAVVFLALDGLLWYLYRRALRRGDEEEELPQIAAD